VICQPCAQAADQQLARDHHCTDPGCTCGHRVERYGTVTEQSTAATSPNQRRRDDR
jgi:hypothetical protein